MPVVDGLPCLEYAYQLSCNQVLDVTVQARSLDARQWISPDGHDDGDEYFATAQVFCGGFPMHALQQCTRLSTAKRGRVHWLQWLTPPVRYCDLQLDACVVVSVVSARHGELGVGVVSLFDEHGRLRRGRMQVRLNGEQTETSRLWQIGEKYNNGKVVRVSWLDALARARTRALTHNEAGRTSLLTLTFPYFEQPVLFEEKTYFPERIILRQEAGFIQDPEVLYGARSVIRDGKELANPVEEKYRKLNPNPVRGVVDKELKPNKHEKEQIKRILASSKQFTRDNQDIIWKFCYSLTSDRKALIKFVMSVDWKSPRETSLAAELLESWAQIDIADALRLLGDEDTFRNPVVRGHAIRILDQASDAELQLYLLQLVQALRYDRDIEEQDGAAAEHEAAASPTGGRSFEFHSGGTAVASPAPLGLLARFLIRRTMQSETLVSFFMWYLNTEQQSMELFSIVRQELVRQLQQTSKGAQLAEKLKAQEHFVQELIEMGKEGRGRAATRQNYLQRMLQQRDHRFHKLCTLDEPVIHPLWPEQSIVGVDPESVKVFSSKTMPIKVDLLLSDRSETGSPLTSPAMFKIGDDLRQDQLVLQLMGVMDKMFKDVNLDLHLTLYRVLPFSKDEGMMEFVPGSVSLTQIQRVDSTISNFFHKRAKEVAALERKAAAAAAAAINQDDSQASGQSGGRTGDSRTDGATRRGSGNATPGLNPTSFNTTPASSRRERSEQGIYEDMVSNFIKSCAGYCMCTYVLGVGDRHLDNILVRRDTGALFHIDFGFIMGHDPRSWAVGPIRITKDMIETMGGRGSPGFEKFVSHCCEAYRILRNNANLILNLLHLMKHSKVNPVFEDDNAVFDLVHGRLELDWSDEKAEVWLREKINKSEDTLITAISDVMHNANVFLN